MRVAYNCDCQDVLKTNQQKSTHIHTRVYKNQKCITHFFKTTSTFLSYVSVQQQTCIDTIDNFASYSKFKDDIKTLILSKKAENTNKTLPIKTITKLQPAIRIFPILILNPQQVSMSIYRSRYCHLQNLSLCKLMKPWI